MKKFFSIVLFSAMVLSLSAKNNANPEAKPSVVSEVVSATNLNGFIFDKDSKESLAGAVITVNGQKIYSDLDGKFAINNINNAKLQVKVSMISYEEKTFELDPANSTSLKIELKQR